MLIEPDVYSKEKESESHSGSKEAPDHCLKESKTQKLTLRLLRWFNS